MSSLESVYAISPSPDGTISIELIGGGFPKKKYYFVFEHFCGQLIYVPEHPEASSIRLDVDSNSVICRDARLGSKEQAIFTRTARARLCAPPQITFASTRISPKPLRGFVVEGSLQVCGVSRTVKANAAFGEPRYERIQIDADAGLRLSDFGLKAPSSFFGLMEAKDEVLLRVLVWGTTSMRQASQRSAQAAI